MEIGMSLACFYPMEPERVVPVAADLKIPICEVFLNTLCELDEAYLRKLRKACDQKGIRIWSVHPFTSAIENYLFFSPYPRRIADSIDFYRRYAQAAQILGATVVNIHGDRGIGLENIDEYASCLAPLMTLQRETGILFSLENVFYNSVNHPEFAYRLRRKVPEVRYTLDIKQAFKGGQDPYALAEAMGDAMVNFHVNDRDDENLCLLPGRGTVDFERIGRTIKQSGYQGPGLIEVYRKNFDGLEDVRKAKSFLEEKFILAK